MVRPTRRELFRIVGTAALARYVPACGDNIQSRVFSNDELEALRAFANVIIPEDDEPGGVALGAVPYIEALLTAFEPEVPRIFAGGPFSDRNAQGPNDFATFVELDRFAGAAWTLALFGSSGLPGGAPNEALLGPVVGLGDQLRLGLRAAIASAVAPIGELSQGQRTTLFNAQPDEFKSLLVDLVTEAAFAAPEYGGNRDLAGWRLCHFEGDSLPLGYTQFTPQGYVERPESPMTTANPGPDPAPLGGEVAELIELVVQVLGGRVRT